MNLARALKATRHAQPRLITQRPWAACAGATAAARAAAAAAPSHHRTLPMLAGASESHGEESVVNIISMECGQWWAGGRRGWWAGPVRGGGMWRDILCTFSTF